MDCHFPHGFECPTSLDTYCLHFTNRDERIATRAELDLIDPRLADAIGIFVSGNPPTWVPELIDATLRHWLLPRIEKPRNGTGPRNYFSRIHDIELRSKDSIAFFANTYSMRKNKVGVPVAATLGRNNTWTLSAQDLEEQYPGSVERLQLGIAIGMNVEDLVLQITSDGQVLSIESATLPDITFG
jgi:hypothetical protein